MSLRGSYEEDLTAGSQTYGRYGNFVPFIAEFLTDDLNVLEKRKKLITEDEWSRTKNLSDEYLSRAEARARDGRPVYSSFPASLLTRRNVRR